MGNINATKEAERYTDAWMTINKYMNGGDYMRYSNDRKGKKEMAKTLLTQIAIQYGYNRVEYVIDEYDNEWLLVYYTKIDYDFDNDIQMPREEVLQKINVSCNSIVATIRDFVKKLNY